MSEWGIKRKKPYTPIGIQRKDCIRGCGNKAMYQWNICADGGYYRPICGACDVLLNEVVLIFMKHPARKQLMKEYAEYVEA